MAHVKYLNEYKPNPVLIETAIPARLDRLRWGRFHTLVVVALGITWILDGLEVTLAGAVAGALKESPSLNLTNAEVGLASSFYLAGAVLGALLFGWLTDRLGRKRLFFITLTVYLLATAATAFSWDFLSFALYRFLTGAGIGGEYTAIASTIQEFVPARYRGWTDLVINGSFWIGAALGAGGSIVLLNPALLPPDLGWRAAFFIGSVLGLFILVMRSWISESPRWLMTHGRPEEAHEILDAIEDGHRRRGHHLPDEELATFRLLPRHFTPLHEVWGALFGTHRKRTFVGLSLMVAQAFFYNAIFFTYALVLTDFYDIEFEPGRLVSPALRRWQLSWPPPARAPVRHRWPTSHDRHDLCTFRIAARPYWRPVCGWCSLGNLANGRVDDHFLLCFGGGELCLSHRQRDFSARDSRVGNRVLLCRGHRYRRCRRALVVRRPDRHQLAGEFIRRVSFRGGTNACRSVYRTSLRG